MKYSDGNDARLGDRVMIDGKYQGLVVASIDTGEYMPGHSEWGYLMEGIIVDTDFGGLVHYTSVATGTLELVSRS